MAKPIGAAATHLPAARAGSREALGEALEACKCYLLLIADQELGPDLRGKSAPSDLVQETFHEAQRDFARFEGTTDEEWRAWLRGLLLHRLANFRRRYRGTRKRSVGREVALDAGDSSVERGGALAADTPSPSGQAMAREQALALQQALARLPDDYRQVIAGRYQEQLSFEEIGRRSGRSAEAARKLWWRAIERLQEELDASS
jgi:RNA polymerase sigma-70 factor (ECF subfamily)